MRGPPPHAAVLAIAHAAPLALFVGHFEPFFPPQPIDAFFVHHPAFPPQQCPYPTVAVAGILPREHEHPLFEDAVLFVLLLCIALSRTRLSEYPAGPTLGDA